MNSFYLDASALAKRYVPESGSPLVDEILDYVRGDRIFVLNVGVGEVLSILVRKRNSGAITASSFAQALVDFDRELAQAATINKLAVGNRLATSSMTLIVAHSINSTDAIALRSGLSVAQRLRSRGDDLGLWHPTDASSVLPRPKGW